MPTDIHALAITQTGGSQPRSLNSLNLIRKSREMQISYTREVKLKALSML